MKKILLTLMLGLFIPAAVLVLPPPASALSDLAVGDPLTPGWRRGARRPVAKKKTETPTPAAPSEPAKPATPPAPAK